MNITRRRCMICKLIKSVDEFNLIWSNHGTSINYTSYCRSCDAIRRRDSKRKQRLRVIFHYSNGTNSCKCCNETRLEFLSLDHINNGKGNPNFETSNNKFARLIRENFPEGYQVLCHNCNQAKGTYGICPHQTIYNEDEEIYNLYA